jgi:hypothetical protein
VNEYRHAAVCKRGHVVTSDVSLSGLATPHCEKCGAEVLTACPTRECGRPIRGRYKVDGVVDLVTKYKAPQFCADCGSPFPWASRQTRIYELQNLLDAEHLDPATELTVREQLNALTESGLDAEEERKGWERVRRLAPTLWEKTGAQKILVTVISAELKRQLGL